MMILRPHRIYGKGKEKKGRDLKSKLRRTRGGREREIPSRRRLPKKAKGKIS